MKDKIATFLEVSVMDMLIIGKESYESGCFFPYAADLAKMPERSPERAEWIFNKVIIDEFKIDLEISIPYESMQKLPSTNVELKKYINGDLYDAEFCELVRHLMRGVLKHYL